MPDDAPEISGAPDPRDAAARALADEMRALVDALVGRDLPEAAALEAARDDVRRALARLTGAPRSAWHEGGGADPATFPASRRAYLEQSPVRGHLNPVAPPLELEVVEGPDRRRRVIGRARLGRRYEGPPHGVHGGWVAALFDEVLGHSQGLEGGAGMTAVLTVRYRHVTPLDETLRFEGWVAERRGRRLVARATCHAGETLTAEAEGVFVKIDFERVADRMRRRRERGGDGDGCS